MFKLSSKKINSALFSSIKHLEIVKFLTQKELRDSNCINKDLIATINSKIVMIAYQNDQKEIIDYFEFMIQGK